MRTLKLSVTKNTLEYLGSIGVQTVGILGIESYIKAALSNVYTSDMEYMMVCSMKWVQRESDVHSLPKLPVEAGVKDHDLNLFICDCPFNFAFKQALQHVGDPRMLAEVARLHTLVAYIRIYLELAQSVQELSTAVHQFQKRFNDAISQMVIHFEATKKRLEAARARSCIQAALVNLTCMRELQGQIYWPKIQGMLEDPEQHYIQPDKTETLSINGEKEGDSY
jgi:hypothetical protein